MATNTSNLPQVIDINQIDIAPTRRRVELEDARKMAASIREHGLIQPIVLAHTVSNPHGIGDRFQLVAGGHRIAAFRLLGWQYLTHFEHFILRGEDANSDEGKLRLSAVELEENLRRKEMSWSEQIEAKQRLFELMEKLHGSTGAGRPTLREQSVGSVDGFGVRKLAAMLGESVGTVSQDLQLAKMVRVMPQLAKQESKSAATRVGTLQVAIGLIKKEQAQKTSAPTEGLTADTPKEPAPLPYELYEGKWQLNIRKVADASVDLVYTDLPYGVNLDQMSSHKGAIDYSDDRFAVVKMLPELMNETYRILKDNRFAIFWFGFNYYGELIDAVKHAGFDYNPVPVIWIKHKQSTENPLTRYANAYEQALVIWKGSPRFIRPGQTNLVDIPGVSTNERLQIAQQPVQLVERFIRDMVLPNSGARVVDFCAGSGTTGVASLNVGCYPILFERSSDQCLIINQRMKNASPSNVSAVLKY